MPVMPYACPASYPIDREEKVERVRRATGLEGPAVGLMVTSSKTAGGGGGMSGVCKRVTSVLLTELNMLDVDDIVEQEGNTWGDVLCLLQNPALGF